VRASPSSLKLCLSQERKSSSLLLTGPVVDGLDVSDVGLVDDDLKEEERFLRESFEEVEKKKEVEVEVEVSLTTVESFAVAPLSRFRDTPRYPSPHSQPPLPKSRPRASPRGLGAPWIRASGLRRTRPVGFLGFFLIGERRREHWRARLRTRFYHAPLFASLRCLSRLVISSRP